MSLTKPFHERYLSRNHIPEGFALTTVEQLGLGECLSEKRQGSLWWKSRLWFMERGLALSKGQDAKILVDFRSPWSYTENIVHHSSNFTYTYSELTIVIYDGDGKRLHTMYEQFNKNKTNDVEIVAQISRYMSDVLWEYVWPKEKERFLRDEPLQLGTLYLSANSVSVGEKTFRWTEFDVVTVNQGRFLFEKIGPDGKSASVAKVSLDKVHNVPIAWAIIDACKPIEGRKRAWYQGWFGIN
ncbi:MAG: DUF6585 family protein [Dehalococcoidia bacterium]